MHEMTAYLIFWWQLITTDSPLPYSPLHKLSA